jgi:hypothetical protein
MLADAERVYCEKYCLEKFCTCICLYYARKIGVKVVAVVVDFVSVCLKQILVYNANCHYKLKMFHYVLTAGEIQIKFSRKVIQDNNSAM